MEKIKKLHAACGTNYLKSNNRVEWTNIDIRNYLKKYPGIKEPDKYVNLNEFPYPFKGNEFDEVYSSHTIEHLDNPIKAVKEFVRITKPRGKIIIRVPHCSWVRTFTDPTHKMYSSLNTINHLIYDLDNVKLILKKLKISENKWLNWLSPFVNTFPNFYGRFLSGILQCAECRWELRIKPDSEEYG